MSGSQTFSVLSSDAETPRSLVQIGEAQPNIAAVRRLLASRDRQIRELQAMFVQLCQKNQEIHERGQRHIASLEEDIQSLRWQHPARLASMVSKLWSALW